VSRESRTDPLGLTVRSGAQARVSNHGRLVRAGSLSLRAAPPFETRSFGALLQDEGGAAPTGEMQNRPPAAREAVAV